MPLMAVGSPQHINCGSLELQRCVNCDFSTNLFLILKAHFRRCAKKGPNWVITRTYFCNKCSFGSHFRLSWFKHVLKCTEDSNFQPERNKKTFFAVNHCVKCPCKIRSVERYRLFNPEFTKKSKDLKRHSKIQMFRCDKCAFKTKTQSMLTQHVASEHSGQEVIDCFTCDKCTFIATKKSILRLHVIDNHLKLADPSKLKFLKCKQTVGGEALNQHIALQDLSPDEINWFECLKCTYKTKGKQDLNEHMNHTHNLQLEINYFQCEKCDFVATKKSSLRIHVIDKHLKPKEQRKPEFFKCDVCSNTIHGYSSLEQHMVVQHSRIEESNWFKCVLCNFKTKLKRVLTRHLTGKHPSSKIQLKQDLEKMYKCDICNCMVKNEGVMRKHMANKHLKPLEFLTSDIRKLPVQEEVSLTQLMTLEHIRPQKVSWFKCEQCDFQTVLRENLRQHVFQTHSEVNQSC